MRFYLFVFAIFLFVKPIYCQHKQLMDSVLAVVDTDYRNATYYAFKEGTQKKYKDRFGIITLELDTVYALWQDNKNQIRFAMIEHNGSWGAYNNKHLYYFYPNGNLAVYRFISGHFQNTCAKNDWLVSIKQKEYDPIGKLLSESEELIDADRKPITKKGCVNTYNEEGLIYLTAKEFIQTYKIKP